MRTLNDYQIALDDVMEFIDNDLLQAKLPEIEADYKANPSLLNKVRLGIIYHEVALNLGFFNKHYNSIRMWSTLQSLRGITAFYSLLQGISNGFSSCRNF